MSKLIQTGNNPRFPKECQKYWKFSLNSAPPEWLTDQAKISEVKDWPILDIEIKSDGIYSVKLAIGTTISVPGIGAWIIYDDNLGFLSMTDKQKELLYEEV